MSTTATAYGVTVLPLATEFGTLAFKPSFFSYIAPNGSKDVFAEIPAVSLLMQKMLPNFLFRSYKDGGGAEAVFKETPFTLTIRYGRSGSVAQIETECEILFTAWHKKTTIGRIKHRLMPLADPRAHTVR